MTFPLVRSHAADLGSVVAVGAEGQLALVGRAEILGLERAAEGEIPAVQDHPAILQTRRAVGRDDVRLEDPRAPLGHLIGVLGGDVRPGDVHALARDGRALRALRAKGSGLAAEVLAKDRQEALHAGVAGVLGIELRGAGEEDVAIGEVEGPRVAVVGIEPGQQPGHPGADVDLVDVAEGLLHEQDAFAVVGEVGPLAEEGQAG